MRLFTIAACLALSSSPSLSLGGPSLFGKTDLITQMSLDFQSIARRTMPAVVSINSVKRIDSNQMSIFFEWSEPDEMDPKAMGIGSGIIIRSDGTILTNHHVVENAEQLVVTLDETHRYKAQVIGSDPKTDLAVIRIIPQQINPGPLHLQPEGLATVRFGDSDRIRVGDWAIAIGSPFGLSKSMSFGIISAKGREQMGVLEIEDFIQTDAAINPGSSGGPLLNSKGEVIGISTAIFSRDGGFSGVGFAIPSRIAKDVAEQIIQKGRVTRGWIGVVAQDLTSDLAEYFKPGVSAGAVISRVFPKSPALQGDLRPGDVVERLHLTPITSATQLRATVSRLKPGQEVTAFIRREQKPARLTISIKEEPPKKRIQAGLMPTESQRAQAQRALPALGIIAEDIPKEVIEFLDGNVSSGVIVVGVHPGTAAFDAGIYSGDIVLNVNQQEIKSMKDFRLSLKNLKRNGLNVFYIQRGANERLFIPLRS